MSQQTEIYSFKVTYTGGTAGGRIEATDATHASERLVNEFPHFVSGSVKLLKNQKSARNGNFWAIKKAGDDQS